MEMDMELKAYPYGLVGKSEPLSKFTQYFDVQTLDELIMALRHACRSGYLTYEVLIAPSFIAKEEAYRARTLRLDVFKEPTDPVGSMKFGQYRLNGLYSKIENAKPLSERELDGVLKSLPNDMAERYLRFKITKLDQKKARELVKQPVVDVDDFEPLSYNGLSVVGTDVTYLGQPIRLRYQLRQILRVFLEHPNELLWPGLFTGNTDIFSPEKFYGDAGVTLSKYIPALHKKLQLAVGSPCIFNEPKEGWRLAIE